MTRIEATHIVREQLADEAVIASLGHPAYDLYVAGDRPENFYTWGSMGVATSVGLGVAMARPERQVVVLDGDGSLLMNLGSLATIASVAPPNLTVVVWDNGEYGTTGGQPTATARGADLERVAVALGVSRATTVASVAALQEAIRAAVDEPGPWMIVAKVTESAPAARPPLDCVFIKQRFMAAIGSAEVSTSGQPLEPRA